MFFNVVPQKRLPPATEANIETKVSLYAQGLQEEIRNQNDLPFMLYYFAITNHRTNLQTEAFQELEEEQLQIAERRPRG